MKNLNSFNSEQIIEINNKKFNFFDLTCVEKHFEIDLKKIPISIKVILENLLRNEDGENINKDMISQVFNSLKKINKKNEKIILKFKSKSFLRNQVRSMVGCIVLLGKDIWSLNEFEKVFRSKKRSLCAPPAPAEGLYLSKVVY